MAEASLQSAGRDFASADRYQVVVSVDASELANAASADTAASGSATSASSSDIANKGTSNQNCTSEKSPIPPRRPTVKGAGSIARETARRIACDCSITVNTTSNGEPVNIGRKSRLWPASMARAIKDRDQHCQFPGCTHMQNLQIHHIRHWADKGKTSIDIGVCICSYHHTLLHEGGYTIQRIANDEQLLNEQFARQQNANDPGQFDFERSLRNNKDSFDTVCKLLPKRYRFRVVDAEGQDIRDKRIVSADDQDINVQPMNESSHSTRVYCSHERGSKNVTNKKDDGDRSGDSASTSDVNNSSITNSDTTHYKVGSPDKDDHRTRIHCAEPRTARYHYTINYAIRPRYDLRYEKNQRYGKDMRKMMTTNDEATEPNPTRYSYQSSVQVMTTGLAFLNNVEFPQPKLRHSCLMDDSHHQ